MFLNNYAKIHFIKEITNEEKSKPNYADYHGNMIVIKEQIINIL